MSGVGWGSVPADRSRTILGIRTTGYPVPMSFGIQRILWTVVAALVGIWLLPATAAPLLEDTPELGWVVIAVLDATLVGFAVWLWRQPNGQR